MAFLSGIQVVYVPAGALNNAGQESGQQAENRVVVKKLRMGRQAYPYVSAQAWRYWLRSLLAKDPEWKASPIFRESKIAYTDANPIKYDDDDLFGYMRAPSKKADARTGKLAEGTPVEKDKEKESLTRVSPFRVGTLVGLAPAITADFGTMSRHVGDPVPHEHEFYSTSLRGLFGLDLGRVGVFTAVARTGFQNLDSNRKREALEAGAQEVAGGEGYILPDEERWRRIRLLLEALPRLEGGAKQTLHATDVTPVVVLMAVFRGGINPFFPVIVPDEQGHATLHLKALAQLVQVWQDQLLSPLYLGWVEGYPPENGGKTADKLRSELQAQELLRERVVVGHPREVFQRLIEDLRMNPTWWAAELPF
ncbi:MAG: type I-B CRISPR-associated protein Cas7/Cst2/DevR [Bacteroidetes bacterium]|nr:MAG: type I-B CRISPR-associated protein Cas7/Cst2/DevR [Bacteroidota bacterium]